MEQDHDKSAAVKPFSSPTCNLYLSFNHLLIKQYRSRLILRPRPSFHRLQYWFLGFTWETLPPCGKLQLEICVPRNLSHTFSDILYSRKYWQPLNLVARPQTDWKIYSKFGGGVSGPFIKERCCLLDQIRYGTGLDGRSQERYCMHYVITCCVQWF